MTDALSTQLPLHAMETVYMKQNEPESYDIIIRCKETDVEKKITHTIAFHAQKAILACHSAVFSDMFQTCKEDMSVIPPEVVLNEPIKTVKSAMYIMYGIPDDDEISNFDHWINVAEFGNKYCATIIINRAILQLCRAFRRIAFRRTSLSPTFEHATVLKYFVTYRQIQNGEMSASRWILKEIVNSLSCWETYCEEYCNVNFEEKVCGCKKNSQDCCSGNGNPLTLQAFVNIETSAFFTSTDLMSFYLLLQDYNHSDNNLEELLKKYFS